MRSGVKNPLLSLGSFKGQGPDELIKPLPHSLNQNLMVGLFTRCLKNIPNIFDCNLKMDYRILIFFGKNIPQTTGHQIVMYFSTSPIVFFCTTWGNQNPRNIALLLKVVLFLNVNNAQKHILFMFLTPWLTLHPIVSFFFQLPAIKLINMLANCAITNMETISPFTDSSIDNAML